MGMTVRDSQLCFACLKAGHEVRDCCRKRVCWLGGCDKFHNRLLQDSGGVQVQTVNGGVSTSLTVPRKGGKYAHDVAPSSSTAPKVLLRLLPMKLFGPREVVSTYAVFD